MPPFPISRILVFGASGQFGRRLCRRLVQLGGFSLLLGGRDEQRLKVARRQLCALKPDARIDTFTCGVAVPGLPDLLRAQKINLVIHLAGPFQGQDYTSPKPVLKPKRLTSTWRTAATSSRSFQHSTLPRGKKESRWSLGRAPCRRFHQQSSTECLKIFHNSAGSTTAYAPV